MKCALCDWQGADLQPVASSPQGGEVIFLCSACIKLDMDIYQLGAMQPAKLVPVIRAIVAQATSGVLSQMLGDMVRLIGKLGQRGLDMHQQAQVLEEIIQRTQEGIPLQEPKDPEDYGPN